MKNFGHNMSNEMNIKFWFVPLSTSDKMIILDHCKHFQTVVFIQSFERTLNIQT